MDSTLLVNVIGFAATVFSVFMWIPQARITWQNRNDAARLAGVSETTQWLSMIGYLLWGAFGVLSESFWVMAPSLVSFPLSLATIIVIRRGRRLPPATRSVPIIATTGPLSEILTTASIPIVSTAPIPIVSTAGSVTVGGTAGTGAYAPTGSIPVLAS